MIRIILSSSNKLVYILFAYESVQCMSVAMLDQC